ncbi:MAG: DUF192 domain-containing protein [Gammaproteobacteria bacterium]
MFAPLIIARADGAPPPPEIALTINGAAVRAEIAATPAARRLGLSHRAALPPARGMLLAFPRARRFCLWMRDVSFPLDAAFIDGAGNIVGIARMQPHTEELHCAPSPAKYALEAANIRAKPGDKVFGLPAAEIAE